MAIAFNSGGSAAVTTASTSFTVNITSAAVGADCYCWKAINVASASISLTGWTTLAVVTTASTTTVGLFYRRKVSGDTTFTGTTTSGRGVHAWASYTGLDTTTPHEAAGTGNVLVKNAASFTVSTPSVSESGGNSWAVAFFASRGSVSGNKVITWTPPAGMSERFDVNNSASTSGPWNGVEIADSNGTVTAGAHSYTATANFSETHGAGALLYLNEAAASGGTSYAAAGTTAATTTASGATTARMVAAGIVAATALATGAATARLSASGETAATSATNGSATVLRPASGPVPATSGSSGATTARLTAAGTIAASGATTGSASIIGGPVAHPAAGLVAVVSATTGAVTLRAATSGTTSAVSDTTGSTSALYVAGGTVAATSETTGEATNTGPATEPRDVAVVSIVAHPPRTVVIADASRQTVLTTAPARELAAVEHPRPVTIEES